jgi:hypothetical protein
VPYQQFHIILVVELPTTIYSSITHTSDTFRHGATASAALAQQQFYPISPFTTTETKKWNVLCSSCRFDGPGSSNPNAL